VTIFLAILSDAVLSLAFVAQADRCTAPSAIGDLRNAS
jgi:hypothetical protein